MNNADMPAGANAPPPADIADLCSENQDWSLSFLYQQGLTKREHFAGLAMQAIIIGNNADICALGEGAAKDAIKTAETLLKELEK